MVVLIKKLLLILLLLPRIALAKHHHHHVNVDTTPQAGFTLESDIYPEGSYYYPTFTQNLGEFSFGVSGQNLSTWDSQDSIYGMAAWTHELNDDLTASVGVMAGSTIIAPKSDVYYYAVGNYDVCDVFVFSAGAYVENSILGFTTSATATFNDFQIAPFYTSGNGNMSGLGVNVNYQLNDNWQPYVGYGYSGGESYLALGVNFSFDD